MIGTVLPPGSSSLERALEQVAADLLDLPTPLRDLWSPAHCPPSHLPWLGWGVSVDIWDAAWPIATKRAAVANAITDQKRKGTLASLRTVLDRFDPLIEIVEWFQDRINLAPHMFRLELPLLAEGGAFYDEALIAEILRDIAAVKPVRSHMAAVFRLKAEAHAWILSAAHLGGMTRVTAQADVATAADPVWASYLQTANGEPFQAANGDFLGT